MQSICSFLIILIHCIPIKRIRWILYRYFVVPPSSLIIKKSIFKNFKRKVGYTPNIDYPQTFNEKLQWLKLYYRNYNMPLCADKYCVRDFVSEHGLVEHLVKLYGKYNKFSEINFDELPNRFVIKVNHNSGGVFVVKDKNIFDTKHIEIQITKLLSRLYEHGINNGEWHYFYIKPSIIIEEYIEDHSGELLDYKIHCFNGQPRYVQVDVGRFRDHKRIFFDLNWAELPLQTSASFPQYKGDIDPPKKLSEMLHIASKLSKDFPYVRVDLYYIQEIIYFGELTFFPANGFGKVTPQGWDLKLGSELDISKLLISGKS